jgi:TolB protein
MKFKSLILSLFLTGAAVAVDAPPEEIRIYLSTTSPLEPIYVGKFLNSDNSLSPEYLSQLESVLNFDFNHNGSTKVLSTNDQRERLLRLATPTERFNAATWKSWGAAYVLRGEVQNKSLSFSVFSLQNSS